MATEAEKSAYAAKLKAALDQFEPLAERTIRDLGVTEKDTAFDALVTVFNHMLAGANLTRHEIDAQAEINKRLRDDNSRLQQRIAVLEGQQGYETIGEGADGKPRIRRL